LGDVIGGADVVVDFTSGEGATEAIETALAQGKHLVIGSTGIPQSAIERAETLAIENNVGVFIAPNFTVGVAVMMHLVREASRFFDYADLLETHHEAKIDAPSGTALAIAQAAAEGKGSSFNAPVAEKALVAGTRGGTHEGVVIHSARMPGKVAHHEIVFGHVGQTLSIKHDSVNRESFMPGVMLAIREIRNRPGLTIGLDKLMGL
jgi:4-hydroxy-tetrahydrodipicolinate reductase